MTSHSVSTEGTTTAGTTTGTSPGTGTSTRTGSAPRATRHEPAPRDRVAGPVTFRRVVASELAKIRTLRSTTWALVLTGVGVLLVGAFSAVGIVVTDTPEGAQAAAVDPTGGALTGVSLGMYVAVALGVLAVGSEYSGGSIRVSLAAVPRRARLVWGKAAAVAALMLPVALAAMLATFLVARAIVAVDDVSISLTSPGVARAVVGGALYLTVVAVLGVATGWLLRSTAGSLAALVAVLTLLPSLAVLLPPELGERVLPFLPSNAGTAILQLTPTGQLDPWTGFAVFCGYAVLALLLAARVVGRRDA